jgi:hypothetical protein
MVAWHATPNCDLATRNAPEISSGAFLIPYRAGNAQAATFNANGEPLRRNSHAVDVE